MAERRIGGIIFLKVNAEQFQAKGNFTYNIGIPKKEMIVGSDAVHGFKEMPQIPMIEGVITDSSTLSLESLQGIRDATVTLELANGKIIVLREAIFAEDGNVTTEEGEITVRFEGISAEEVR